MSTQHNLYTVGNSTAIAVATSHDGSGRDITIQNVNDDGYIYVGGVGVTTSNYGYRVSPNSAISFELTAQDELFIIGSATNLKAAIITINLESEN
jgi:uncharacterized membrane protein